MKRSVVALATALLVPACGTSENDGDDDVSNVADLSLIEANDLSILVPTTNGGGASAWIAPDSPARGGELVPSAYLQTLAEPAVGSVVTDVVGVRVDPCFRGKASDPCQPQLRLVFTANFEDIAVHALYRLTDDELASYLADLADLRKTYGAPAATERVLDVNDILQAQGMNGAYATKVRADILTLCGPANLVRVTRSHSGSLSLGGGLPDDAFGPPPQPDSIKWTFDAVDGAGHRLGNAAHEDVQVLETSNTETKVLGHGTYTSAELALDKLADLDTVAGVSLADLQAARGAIITLEDPAQSQPDEVTCVGCHLAAPLRRAIDAARDEAWPADPYTTTHPINELAADFGSGTSLGASFRMFGYWGGAPSISRRVARETADILDAVHAMAVQAGD